MIDILNQYRDRLQHELNQQCVNDTESILQDLDWWGGLVLPEGHSFDFNIYEVSHTDVDGALKAVAYYFDQVDKLGVASSSYAYSIDLEVPQFLVDQYHLRKGSKKKYKARIFYNMFEDVEFEAENYEKAREKAFELGGTGTTHTHFDFLEVEEVQA